MDWVLFGGPTCFTIPKGGGFPENGEGWCGFRDETEADACSGSGGGGGAEEERQEAEEWKRR